MASYSTDWELIATEFSEAKEPKKALIILQKLYILLTEGKSVSNCPGKITLVLEKSQIQFHTGVSSILSKFDEAIERRDTSSPELLCKSIIIYRMFASNFREEEIKAIFERKKVISDLYLILSNTYAEDWDRKIKTETFLFIKTLMNRSTSCCDALQTQYLLFDFLIKCLDEFYLPFSVTLIDGDAVSYFKQHSDDLAFLRAVLATLLDFYSFSSLTEDLSSHEPRHQRLIDILATFWTCGDVDVCRDVANLFFLMIESNGQTTRYLLGKETVLRQLVVLLCLQEEQRPTSELFSQILLPVLQICGHIAAGSNEQADFFLQFQLLPRLLAILREFSQWGDLQREICFIVANLSNGSGLQRRAVYDSDFLPEVVEVFLRSSDESARHSAAIMMNTVLFPELQEEALRILASFSFSRASQSLRDQQRMFVLKVVECLSAEGFPRTTRRLLAKAISVSLSLGLFFFSESPTFRSNREV